MKGEIVLIPLTEKGRIKFSEHIKETTLKDKLKMKRQGVMQRVEGQNIIIQFKDLRINFLARHFQDQYTLLMHANKTKLTEEMEKLGIEEDKDFKVVIE